MIWSVSLVVEHTISVQEIWGSIPSPVKSAQCRQRLATVATFLRSIIKIFLKLCASLYNYKAAMWKGCIRGSENGLFLVDCCLGDVVN